MNTSDQAHVRARDAALLVLLDVTLQPGPLLDLREQATHRVDGPCAPSWQQALTALDQALDQLAEVRGRVGLRSCDNARQPWHGPDQRVIDLSVAARGSAPTAAVPPHSSSSG
jgi:hypothetical protein